MSKRYSNSFKIFTKMRKWDWRFNIFISFIKFGLELIEISSFTFLISFTVVPDLLIVPKKHYFKIWMPKPSSPKLNCFMIKINSIESSFHKTSINIIWYNNAKVLNIYNLKLDMWASSLLQHYKWEWLLISVPLPINPLIIWNEIDDVIITLNRRKITIFESHMRVRQQHSHIVKNKKCLASKPQVGRLFLKHINSFLTCRRSRCTINEAKLRYFFSHFRRSIGVHNRRELSSPWQYDECK